jgi:hypothetical protein
MYKMTPMIDSFIDLSNYDIIAQLVIRVGKGNTINVIQ